MSEEQAAVTEAEIFEYAEYLGMNLEEDEELLWIAEMGLQEPLPKGWKGCVTDDGDLYYFNFDTGDSQWHHPNDSKFKQMFKEEKEKLRTQEQMPLPPVVRRNVQPLLPMGSSKPQPSVTGTAEPKMKMKPQSLGTGAPLGPLKNVPSSSKGSVTSTSPLPSPQRNEHSHISTPPIPEDDLYSLSDEETDELDVNLDLNDEILANDLIAVPTSLQPIEKSVDNFNYRGHGDELLPEMTRMNRNAENSYLDDDGDEYEEEESMVQPPRPSAPTPPLSESDDEGEGHIGERRVGHGQFNAGMESAVAVEDRERVQRESALKAILAEAEAAAEAEAGRISPSDDEIELVDTSGDKEWRAQQRARIEREREQYIAELNEETERWKQQEESRVKLVAETAIEALQESQAREMENIKAEHSAAITRLRHQNELEIANERSSHDRRLLDMRAGWDAEVATARLETERLIKEVRESASAGRLAEIVSKTEAEESKKIEETLNRMRETAEREQKELAAEFSRVKKEQRDKLNYELESIRASYEREVATIEAELSSERAALLEQKRAKMRYEVDATVEEEKVELKERESVAVAALRECAENAERRATSAAEAEAEAEDLALRAREEVREEQLKARFENVNVNENEAATSTPTPKPHQPIPPLSRVSVQTDENTHTNESESESESESENASPSPLQLQSTLRIEAGRIEEQVRILNDRARELQQHKAEIESAVNTVRHDASVLRERLKVKAQEKEKGNPDAYRDHRAVIDQARSYLEQETLAYNREAKQIEASKRYLQLRRKRVKLMQQSLSQTQTAGDSFHFNMTDADTYADFGSETHSSDAGADATLNDEILNVEHQLAGVLNELRGDGDGDGDADTATLRTKYHTLFPNFPSAHAHAPQQIRASNTVAMYDFKLRMRAFKDRLVSWEKEREGAVKQLSRHKNWLKRFKRDVQWGTVGVPNPNENTNTVNNNNVTATATKGNGVGGVVTINLNVK